MKELSIQEKAKRYDEALARAKEMIKSMTNIGGVAKVDDIQHIFPELKESEDEKWIPKEIIKYLKEKGDFRSCWIAWLEKQGVHAKFINGIKVGDKVTRNEYGVLVNLSQLNRVANKQVEHKPAAWSKEDEKQARQIERIVHDGCTQKLQKQIADWFKSLKERYTWKPSEEQMKALKQAKTDACGKPYFSALASLYINLKGY